METEKIIKLFVAIWLILGVFGVGNWKLDALANGVKLSSKDWLIIAGLMIPFGLVGLLVSFSPIKKYTGPKNKNPPVH